MLEARALLRVPPLRKPWYSAQVYNPKREALFLCRTSIGKLINRNKAQADRFGRQSVRPR
jgi:hypothetical protein